MRSLNSADWNSEKDAAAEADALPQPRTLESPGASAGQSHTVHAHPVPFVMEQLGMSQRRMA